MRKSKMNSDEWDEDDDWNEYDSWIHESDQDDEWDEDDYCDLCLELLDECNCYEDKFL